MPFKAENIYHFDPVQKKFANLCKKWNRDKNAPKSKCQLKSSN